MTAVSKSAARRVEVRSILTEIKRIQAGIDALLADHALTHLEADMQWRERRRRWDESGGSACQHAKPGDFGADPHPAGRLHRAGRIDVPAELAAVIGFGTAASITKSALATDSGSQAPAIAWPGHVYLLTLGAGLLVSVLVILTTLPLLSRMSEPEGARSE